MPSSDLVTIGKLGAPFGVKGWVKVYSYTDPADNILNFKDWHLTESGKETLPVQVVQLKSHKDHFVGFLEGVTDRQQVALFTGKNIAVDKKSLPKLQDGYYWVDLVGVAVYNQEQLIGQVKYLFATGANDVMVVADHEDPRREHLIPWIDKVIVDVQLESQNKRIIVDWQLL